MKFPTFAAASAFVLQQRKKVLRFLIRGSAVLATLVILFYAIMNWWGAGKRKEATARLNASGLPMTLADFVAGQPADSDNFALIPLLKSATLQALELNDGIRRSFESRHSLPPQPGPELLMIRMMGDPALQEFVKKINRMPRADHPDFSKMGTEAGYGLSAESFLAEYDRRNASALEAFRQGMSRPVTQTPLLTPGFEKDLQNSSTAFYFDLKKAANGLCLRADAALATGDSTKATESLVLALRLGEVAGSKGFFVSPLLELFILTEVNARLVRGVRQHRWTEENLHNLRSALVRMDLRGNTVRSFEANTHHSRIWWNWSDHRPQDASDEIGEIWGSTEMPFEIAHFPSGWFDANGASAVNHALDFALLARSQGPLKRWTDAAEKAPKPISKNFLSKFFYPNEYSGEEPIIFRCAYMLVLRSQAVLAIEIERLRVRAGSYPDTMDAVATSLTIDPLFETPFHYRKTGDSFQLYSFGPDGDDDNLARKPNKSLGEFLQDDWVW